MADNTVRAARGSGNYRRARVATYRPDTDIVRENVESEWEKGCRWAGFAIALTFGPMLALGIYWGW